ncbi:MULTISPECIES: site-specific DNA-methyltransferase [Morganella]|jgi:adenine-specific DNA-methyltransferase|uniref:site-specific DNA-methyltransferase n=1 Tax=Morganella TaxID=581 RepID=UPI00244CE317|nr:site-specific DNA-methyltransferase [Morganella sp. GD04133]MDH0354038.1 site-specific DNA-methyltransferase [Morganella sp. GD04133]HED3889905.1 site-specific DNA-methyltransferase [Morganella morganii]
MTHKPEVMGGESLDIAAQRRDELKQLFPGVFTETKDADGNVVSSIDFERLKAELGTFSDIYEGRRERYGMEWPGKRDCMKMIQEPSRATLKPCPDESADWDTTKNLFIEGDNLEVLKLLQKSYYGKVKMIYIDPPYNTGNEFIYPDNYQETLDTYLAYAGLLDDEGKTFTTNTTSEGRFHSKWLNMMFPRIYLAKNLLKDDGVIFVSIDDNEVENTRRLLDEIFGEENFVAQFTWSGGRKNDSKLVSVSHEYVVCYVKSTACLSENKITWRQKKKGLEDIYKAADKAVKAANSDFEEATRLLKAWFKELPNSAPAKQHKHYSVIDKNGVYFPADISWPGGGGPKYEVLHPITGKPVKIPSRGWMFSDPEKMNDMIKNGRVHFGPNESAVPCIKSYLKDKEDQVPYSVFYQDGRAATKRLRALMGDDVFDHPKDELVLKELFEFVMRDGGIAVDFFAGSGSTAHALMDLQNDDGVNRNFILVQLPEKCDEKSGAFKLGYKKISDICLDRIKKASDIYKAKGANFDTGFKVLKLTTSCFKDWQANADSSIEQIQAQLELSVNNIVAGKGQHEILFEILLKAGFEPTESIESINLNGKTVFSVANRALLICLEDQLTAELTDAVIALEPMQFICLDKGFRGNDQLKANTAQAFRARSQDSEAEMVFKVV